MNSALPKRWDTKRFINPGAPFSPVHFWVWNGKCSHDETDRQLDEMYRLGVRAFYIVPEPKNFRPNSMPTDLEPDYLTSEYFDEYLYAIRRAKSMGMNCWLYDEGGWPSGGACGKVIEQHPQTIQSSLRTNEFSFCNGDVYKKQNLDTLAAFTSDAEYINEGFVFKKDTTVIEYYTVKEINLPYPDITKPETTRWFLQLTHDAYKQAAGDEFENLFSAVFTDEPKAPYMTPDNFSLYEQVYGHSILPYVPVLIPEWNPELAKKLLETGAATDVLANWYDLCSHLFCDNFLKVCKKWANDNNMLFTGHMDADHFSTGCMHGGLNFHLMRALRCLDIPGVDVIWRQIFPGERRKAESGENIADNGFFPRYASSAAAQNGVDYALSESLGVYGNGVTFEEMRYCFGFQAIRGINVFNPALISYARSGYALTQEQPCFTEKFACYKYMNLFNEYLERLSYVCSLGNRVCNTALYYPINDFWRREKEETISESFEALGRSLEDQRIDFDIIDDDVIEAAAGIESGCIRMGKACYTAILIPPGAYIPEKITGVLERFSAAGGKIYYNADELRGISLEGKSGQVRMMHRVLENGELYIFFNENTDTADFRFKIEGKNAYRISIEEGKVYDCPRTNNEVHLNFVSGETEAILVTDEYHNADLSPELEKALPLTGFTLEQKNACVLKETGCEYEERSGTQESMALGDWSGITGKDFSGSCVYKTTFTLEDEATEDIILDLGKVCYTCEILLNGIAVCTKIMPPYRCVLHKELLKKTNELALIVTNTMSNQFIYTTVFEEYNERQISQYYEKEIEFMKDSLPSGLFGPVRLIGKDFVKGNN